MQKVDTKASQSFLSLPARQVSCPETFSPFHALHILDLDLPRVKPKPRRLLLERTLPESLLDVLRLETGDIRSAGWSRPPGSREILYQRPRDCMSFQISGPVRQQSGRDLDTCSPVLSANPLPQGGESTDSRSLCFHFSVVDAQYAGVKVEILDPEL